MLATTKMSSKGQVVIPEAVREKLGFVAGQQFIVMGDKGVIVLKSIKEPNWHEFDDLVAVARRQARKTGFKRKDLDDVIKKVRNRKRA